MTPKQRASKLSSILADLAKDLRKAIKKRMGIHYREEEIHFAVFTFHNNPDLPNGHPEKTWISYYGVDRYEILDTMQFMLDKWRREQGNENEVPLHERN